MSDIAGIISRVWPEWTIEKQIGRGAFGQVFQAVRGELGFEVRCAIKAVEVPPDDSETDALRLEGMTEEEIRQYFRRQAESFVGEIRMLDSLKGAPHIVGIEDFRVVEQEDGLSWVILIRMELLTPFPVYVRSAPMTEAETARLGIELCEAMEVCHGLHVIHRDIKPQNIFVDRFGSFRLGDFGIARKMESLTNSMSKKGTYGYLAPEIDSGFHYDERVDIYSLGLVMYQLVNENRMPFLSTPEDARNPEKRTSAMTRRLRGEPLPPPCAASPALADVILKACRYDPDDRFRTASDMKNALLALESGTGTVHAPQIPSGVVSGVVSEESRPAAEAAHEEPADDEATLSPRSAMRKRTAEASGKPDPRDEDAEHTARASSARPRAGSDAAGKPLGKKPAWGKKQILIAVLALLLLSASVFGIAALSRRSTPDGTDESVQQTAENIRTEAETPETEPVYTLEPVSGEGGAVLMEPGSAKLGERVTLTAQPEEGYVFSGWTAEGIELEKPADEAENSFVLTSPDYSLEARFDILHRLEAENRPENLTVRFSPEQAKLGDTVEVTAEPDAGYRFAGWEAEGLTLDRGEREAENSFTLTSDEFSLKALAEPIKYTVSVETDGSGTAEADRDGAVMGEKITLKATPADGYTFKEWKVISGGVTVKDNALTVGTQDVRVRAVFEAVPYTITVSVDGQGSASADKSSAVRGDKITLKATPEDGYYLKEWKVVSGGVTVKDNTITLGTEDVQVRAVFDKGGICGDNLIWRIENGNTLVISGTGAMYDYERNDWDYTSAPWMLHSDVIAALEIKEGVTSVGRNAFSRCFFLVGSLTLPKSLRSIGEYAFWYCDALSGSLTIPDGVTEIEDYAFYSCDFTGSLTIPSSVKKIGDGAFGWCRGLTGSLTIPAGVEYIGGEAFSSCSGFTGDLILPDSVKEIGDSAFSFCSGLTGRLKLPNGIRRIEEYTFASCGFTGTLTIPDGVTYIGESTFTGCSGLSGTLSIPDTVTVIGDYAFSNCNGFSGSLTIPDGVTEIGDWAFAHCGGFSGSLTLGKGLKTIGSSAFYSCEGLTGAVVIPDGVKEIRGNPFAFTWITSIMTGGNPDFSVKGGILYSRDGKTLIACPRTKSGPLVIPDGVTTIGERAFDQCAYLTDSPVLPDSVTVIEDSAFNGCTGLSGRLNLPDSISAIGTYAFAFCSGLTGDLVIPDGVKTIGVGAFWPCDGLNGRLTVPASVTEIGEQAFFSTGLTSAYFYGKAPLVTNSRNDEHSIELFETDRAVPVYCTSANRSSFVQSDGYDSASETWYGCPLSEFEP